MASSLKESEPDEDGLFSMMKQNNIFKDKSLINPNIRSNG